jgi:hypothetical protein
MPATPNLQQANGPGLVHRGPFLLYRQSADCGPSTFGQGEDTRAAFHTLRSSEQNRTDLAILAVLARRTGPFVEMGRCLSLLNFEEG